MGLATTLIDLLLLGDEQLQRCVPNAVSGRLRLPAGAMTSSLQIALYFFMLSHYVADAHMPCHADARALARYDGKLHEKWEKHIDKQIAKFPSSDQLREHTPEALLEHAVAAIPFLFPENIPQLESDIWEEAISICRASFAVNCIIASPEVYPLVKTDRPREDESDLAADAPRPSFDELFAGREALRDEVTDAIVHDAVLSVAMIWKDVWKTVMRRKK